MSGAIDGQRCAGSALSPRSTARRIQVGTSRFSGIGSRFPWDTLMEQLHERLAVEGPLAVERLVKRHAKAELIGALVGRVADDLLGRHVGRRPHDRPGARERLQMVAGALRRRRAT